MKNSMQVGDIACESGMVARGKLRVGETLWSSVDMPVTIINGYDDGPLFAVSAGIHGTEYNGIEATIQLSGMIKPNQLNGAVILVHVVNMAGFERKTPFVCPIDGLNVNRVFPGSEGESMSYRIAHRLFSCVVNKANYYVDLHSGDIPEDHIKVTYYTILGGKTDETSKEMAQYFSTTYTEPHSQAGSASTEACKIGVPAIAAEAGELGKLEEDAVRFHIDGVLNLLRRFGLFDQPPTKTDPQPLGERIVIRADHGGLLHRSAKAGDKVTKNQVLAEIVDIYGSRISAISSPVDGIVLMSYPSPVVSSGDYLYCVCPWSG